jgi:hypothetical protein
MSPFTTKTSRAVLLALSLTGMAIAASAGAKEAAPAPKTHPVHEAQSISLPVTELNFFASGVKTDIGELYAAPAFGDLGHAKHGTFIKMPAGFVSPPHTHTEDYYAVVVSGIGVNTQPGKADIPLAPGSYWFQRGEENHVTKCISKVECIFFITQPGKFDYVPTH